MFRLSNNLIGILNFLTFLLSIPILMRIWLRNHGTSECEKFFDTPVIIIGVFLMVVSLAGLIGACCRVSWLLWLYLFVMFLLIVLLFCFTIFAFVVTNKGAGKVVSERGYKEYRLVITQTGCRRGCLIDGKVCSDFNEKYLNDSVTKLYTEHLSAVQSGCCKPADECGFEYVSPTNWTKITPSSTNPDCSAWDNDPNTLCFNCNSCKAGLLDNIKSDWKKVAVVNIVILVFLIIVYSVGCCAFRNNKRQCLFSGWRQQP
ncbi:hypothetical protein P3X46_031773 [Hevea brasiliensis]|uniref:Tetraspanin-8 n=1 Tax=Hevea brasiliensis TaxID=3981 RepID=A0ABQ9KMR9_HEVBR|nr:hypothetical protein P3X46_031773 [Hevea brasiliensis]